MHCFYDLVKKRQNMRLNRDRWRVYKRISVMFFLAVVALTVVQRGTTTISSGWAPFQLERQARADAGAAAVGRQRGSSLATDSFWKSKRKGPSPADPTNTTAASEKRLPNQGQSPAAWDVITTKCVPNHNFSSKDFHTSLDNNFKQFLMFRHCRFFPMLLNHPEKCGGGTHLLMVVKSVVTQHDRREVIRRTWGKERAVRGKRVKTLFLLGKPSNEAERANHQKLLEFEDNIYGDILQWDFLDSFFNLTLKEVHFLKWFDTYCANVPYVFKGDDDVFVSVDNLFEYLEVSGPAKRLLVGDVLFKAKPIRKKENKYYMPPALYNKTYYPPYAGGGGFLMDGPLVRNLRWASETLELYPIDDVFLGMCLEVLKVTPVKHSAFKTFGLVKNKTSRLNKEPCFYKSMIVVHKLLPSELMHMWNLLNGDLVCSLHAGIL